MCFIVLLLIKQRARLADVARSRDEENHRMLLVSSTLMTVVVAATSSRWWCRRVNPRMLQLVAVGRAGRLPRRPIAIARSLGNRRGGGVVVVVPRLTVALAAASLLRARWPPPAAGRPRRPCAVAVRSDASNNKIEKSNKRYPCIVGKIGVGGGVRGGKR